MDVRKLLNVDMTKGFPTMPAPNSEAKPTKRPIGTDEMKKWLHLVLSQRGHDIGDRKLTSHSCKCTALSWLSKHGDDWADRMALGGHVSFMKSAIVYSRDAMACPLRILETLLSEVRMGIFCPDDARSGRFRTASSQSGRAESAGREVIDDGWTLLGPYAGSSLASNSEQTSTVVDLVESDMDETKIEEEQGESESDAMTTSSSEDEVGAGMTGAARPMKLPTIPDELKLIQHTKYKTLHLVEKQNCRVMLCGRMVVDGRYAEGLQCKV